MQTQPVNLVEIAPQLIEQWWEPVRDMVESACSRSGGRYAVQDVLRMLLQRRMQLWVVVEQDGIDAVVIAEIASYPQLRECRILAATGENAGLWVHLVEQVEEWAMHHDCRKIVCIGRPGWEKSMKKYGYKKTHVYLEKDLGYVH